MKKKSSFKYSLREMMVGENHQNIKMKGAFECIFESGALAKKGGTAEFNFVPLWL